MFFVSLFKSICQTADKKQKEGEGEKKNETCSSLSKEAISIRQFLATELKVGFYFFLLTSMDLEGRGGDSNYDQLYEHFPDI